MYITLSVDAVKLKWQNKSRGDVFAYLVFATSLCFDRALSGF
jgi:hypothetical protein